jgi:ATP synthase protein I
MPLLNKSDASTLRTVGQLSAVGLAFVIAIGLGFWFGTLVDGWLGTSPWFSIIFFFLGLAAGILNVYRTVGQAMGPARSAGKQPPSAQ